MLLVSLNVGWPKLNYQIKNATVGVAANNDDGQVRAVAEKYRTKPQWDIIPTEWRTKLSKIEGEARRMLSQASISFAVAGVSLLPHASAEFVLGKLREQRSMFEIASSEFCTAYPEILQQARHELGSTLYEQLKDKLPEENEVREKFYMRWMFLPLAAEYDMDLLDAVRNVLTDVQGIEASKLPHGRLRDRIDTLMSQLASIRDQQTVNSDLEAMSVIREANEQTRRVLTEEFSNLSAEPRQRITAAVQNLLRSISEERKIMAGTLGQVARACEFASSFSFMLPPEVVQIAEKVRLRIAELSPQELNSDRDVALGITGLLNQLVTAATNETAASAVVQRFRRVAVGGQRDD